MTPSILKAIFIISALLVFALINYHNLVLKLPLFLFNKAKFIHKQKH